MALVRVPRSPSQVRLLPLERPSLHKLKPGSIQIVIFSRKRQRLERHVGLLPVRRVLTWPIFTNGTLSLDQTERIVTRRYGPSIITACESRPQFQTLLSQRRMLLPLPQVLQNPPGHRLDSLPIVENGWKPKMVTPAGLSLMQIV